MSPTGKTSELMKLSRIAALIIVVLVALVTILGKGGDNVAVPSSSEPISIDVLASQVDGDFLLDGGPFPNSIYQSGDLRARDQVTGTMVELGNTYDHNYDIMLVNSTYDSIYEHSNGGGVPVNELGIIQTDIVVDADAGVNVDVPLASVSAQFLLNGGSFPASQYDRGTFYLQPVNSDELILLGDSNVVSDAVNIIPGNYHVIYDYIQGATVPANENARVMSDVAIAGNMPLMIDVPSVTVRKSFLHNGNAFPNSQYERAEFFLVNDAGDEVFLGNSYEGPGSIVAIGGTYDLEYRHIQGDTIPLNAKTVVRTNLDFSSGGDAGVDVTSFMLDINPTLNGQAFLVNEYQDGILELRDVVTGSFSLLGNTHGSFDDLLVIPGSYDFYYSHETGEGVPQNTRGSVATGYVISGDQQLDLDIAGHTLTFSLTLDTAAFPINEYDYAAIFLSGSTSAEDMQVALTYAQDEPVMVLPGTYDVIYSCKNCSTIPFNSYAIIRDDHDISASGVIAASISSVTVITTATLNGNAFPQSIYQSGAIWGGMNDGDAVALTRTNITTDDVILIAGDYQFYYEHRDGDQVPANLWALVGQQSIVAPIN